MATNKKTIATNKPKTPVKGGKDKSIVGNSDRETLIIGDLIKGVLSEEKDKTLIGISEKALMGSTFGPVPLEGGGEATNLYQIKLNTSVAGGSHRIPGQSTTYVKVYKYIKATSQTEGDIHLSDATNWDTDKAMVKAIRIDTTSTDWDLYILQNDNGYSTDDANISKIQLMDGGNGGEIISPDHPYEDEDGSKEVHLYWVDNSGSNTADIYVIGYALK